MPIKESNKENRIREKLNRDLPGQSAIWAYYQAKNVLKDRWPEAELLIMKTPYSAFMYAVNIIKDRWPEAEDTIRGNSYWWGSYNQFLQKNERQALPTNPADKPVSVEVEQESTIKTAARLRC